MKIYDEIIREELTNPDLENGYTYPGRRKTGTELRVLPGTVTDARPGGLRQEVAVYEDCLFYHAYTEDELAAMQQPDDPAPSGGVTWDELAAAYNEGVASV